MISEQEVYNVLTYRWQTGNEIREKIAKSRGKKRFQIAVAPVYVFLNNLERLGFVEKNERKSTKDELEKRRSNKILEYRKISGKEPVYGKFGDLECLTDLGLAST